MVFRRTSLVKRQKLTSLRPAVNATALLLALFPIACESRDAAEARRRIAPVYDRETGKLTVLKYDSNGDGKPDTFSYMDGNRIVRIEIDKDQDGKIDRWEYYGPDRTLEKVGFSRLNDGKVDAWSYTTADGSIARVDVSTHRDGRVDRVEYYEQNAMVRAEEDTDGDGRIDKWEQYDGSRLASVAFDTTHRGTPDRRLVYTADGDMRVEVDVAGDGHFVPSADIARAGRSRD